MIKLIRRALCGAIIVSATTLILFQAIPCLAFDRSDNFWKEQPCGWKKAEGSQGDVPKEVWNLANQIISRNRRCSGTDRVNERIYSICVKYDSIDSDSRVRSIEIRRGGVPIYYCAEKICP